MFFSSPPFGSGSAPIEDEIALLIPLLLPGGENNEKEGTTDIL